MISPFGSNPSTTGAALLLQKEKKPYLNNLPSILPLLADAFLSLFSAQ